MIVLDAGVVIALFSPDDAHHDRAKALFARQAGPFLLHSLTVAETLVAAARVERGGGGVVGRPAQPRGRGRGDGAR